MKKLLMLALSGLASVGLAGMLPGTAGSEYDPPDPQKKKGEAGPAGDLRKAYDLLRRVKAADGAGGRPEERLRDWTERAAKLYRRAVSAQEAGDLRQSREYGTAAHDLGRAIEHARNASLHDRTDPDLPPPPERPGPESDADRVRRDLRRAYDRLQESNFDGPEAKFYLDAARDLYSAARRDAVADRSERAGELARAAEAMTHVPEHLARAAGQERDLPEPKEKAKREKAEPKEKRGKAEPKEKSDRPDDGLPPPLSPRG
jgi:hypothetical protein